MPIHELKIPIPADYSYHSTLYSHGWIQLAPFVWNSDTQVLKYAYHINGRLCRVTIMPEDAQLVATLESDHTLDMAQVERDLRWMLRVDDDLSAFYALCRQESALQHVPSEGGGRLIRSVSIWEDIVKVITTTNTAWSGTRRMCQNLVKHWGEGAFPTAEALAGAKIDMLKQNGGLGYRAPYIHELAQRVADGELDLESLKISSLHADELYKFLRSLKGIGDYAASSILMMLGYYARVPVDSIAHSMVSRQFYDGEPVTPAQIRACFAQYGDFAGLAYWCWKFDDD